MQNVEQQIIAQLLGEQGQGFAQPTGRMQAKKEKMVGLDDVDRLYDMLYDGELALPDPSKLQQFMDRHIDANGPTTEDAMVQAIRQEFGGNTQSPKGPEEAILAQMGPDAGAPPFDPEAFAQERLEAWNNDTTGSEVGFDRDTLQMLVDMLDGEGVNALPAGDVSKALLRGEPSPDVAEAYDALGPGQKLQVLEELVNSDGLGDLEWAIGAVLGETPNTGQRGPVQVGPTPVDENNPSRLEDPMFQEAMAAWIEASGKEPATDADFQEIENMVWQAQQQQRR